MFLTLKNRVNVQLLRGFTQAKETKTIFVDSPRFTYSWLSSQIKKRKKTKMRPFIPQSKPKHTFAIL